MSFMSIGSAGESIVDRKSLFSSSIVGFQNFCIETTAAIVSSYRTAHAQNIQLRYSMSVTTDLFG